MKMEVHLKRLSVCLRFGSVMMQLLNNQIAIFLPKSDWGNDLSGKTHRAKQPSRIMINKLVYKGLSDSRLF